MDPMGKRRRARELALQYLYQWDFHGPEDEGPAEAFWADRHDPAEAVKGHAERIVAGVKERKAEIDALIEGQSQHWKLYRMSRIDRNILRIAIYEMIACPEIPAKVSIDEAIEIGKRFGTTDSSAFINGILDQICRRLGRLTPLAGATDSADDPAGDRGPL
jgi:transcription antitermination protein NusB